MVMKDATLRWSEDFSLELYLFKLLFVFQNICRWTRLYFAEVDTFCFFLFHLTIFIRKIQKIFFKQTKNFQ